MKKWLSAVLLVSLSALVGCASNTVEETQQGGAPKESYTFKENE